MYVQEVNSSGLVWVIFLDICRKGAAIHTSTAFLIAKTVEKYQAQLVKPLQVVINLSGEDDFV